MKASKLISAAMVLAMAVSFAGCAKTEATSDATTVGGDDSAKKQFVVGFDAEFPPMGFQDNNGEYVGFDLDLAKEVADRLHLLFRVPQWRQKQISHRHQKGLLG